MKSSSSYFFWAQRQEIAQRAVRREKEGARAALDWMKSGSQIHEMLLLWGRCAMNEESGESFKGPMKLFGALVGYLPNSERDKAWINSSIWKKILRGINWLCFIRGERICEDEEIRPLQAQKHYANDADVLERYGLFRKSKTSVAKLNALNLEPVFESLRCPRTPSKVWKQLCVMVAVSTRLWMHTLSNWYIRRQDGARTIFQSSRENHRCPLCWDGGNVQEVTPSSSFT